jgi:plasmid maintenance system killer protein
MPRVWLGNCLRYWRLTFAFVNGDAILVDYKDYH